MKINEVVNEIKNPYLRGIVQGITGIDFQPIEKPASQTNLKQPQPTVTSGPAANEPTLNIPQQTTTSTATTSRPQPAQTTYSTTVPPAPKGYINTLDIAGRKFYFNRGDWYEYHGQMWPKDIDVAQKVKDVDQLVPYIKAGHVKQERYGTKKKK